MKAKQHVLRSVFTVVAEDANDRSRQEDILRRRLIAFLNGLDRHCIHCGAEVTALRRRLIWLVALPCGCRIALGKVIPAAWRLVKT